jgi:Ribonuclease G/E
MKGRLILIEPMARGGNIAALVEDGRLADLMVDPAPDDPAPRVEAIARAVPDRPLKGTGGMVLRLPDGQRGFLRETDGVVPGRPLLVQVATHAEEGKAAPVTRRLLFKGRHAIVTPDAPGLNISRRIRDAEARAALEALAARAMTGAPEGFGLILRSAAEAVDAAEVEADIATMLDAARRVTADDGRAVEWLLDAPDAAFAAWRDWPEPDEVVERPGALEIAGAAEAVAALQSPLVALDGSAFMAIEPVRALVAVDVNTGGEASPAAALKANIAAARDLPRQLRLRGLGGQVAVDFAPLSRKDRPQVEGTLKAALRQDGIETAVLGWGPLGLLELNRKRERRPLAGLLP